MSADPDTRRTDQHHPLAGGATAATGRPRPVVPSLVVTGVSKTYRRRGHRKNVVTAVDDVSFTVTGGAAIGLVGASGSGKSTSQVQMIFQDPYGALNPLHTVEYTVTRPCQNFLGLSATQARVRVHELLETVGLTPAAQYAAKLPHQLSGGQRQRVVIARALACDPDLIVADEPVSMLDVSLRADVLRLLAQLRAERGLSLLYITHDLLSARVVTDEILVLNAGRVVERGPTKAVLQHPQDDYTKLLLDAVATPFADHGPADSQP